MVLPLPQAPGGEEGDQNEGREARETREGGGTRVPVVSYLCPRILSVTQGRDYDGSGHRRPPEILIFPETFPRHVPV